MSKRHLLALLALFMVGSIMVIGCEDIADEPAPVPAPTPAPEGGDAVDLDPITAAGYVGSDSCMTCHSGHYEGWKGTKHPYLIMPAEEGIWDITREFMEAEFAKGEESDFTLIGGTDRRITSLDEVDYTSGNYWKQRLVVRTEEGHRFVGSQINPRNVDSDGVVTEARLTSYKTSNFYEDRCLACHSTGFNYELSRELDRTATDYSLESLAVELGVGCEACHGPAAEHAKAPAKDNVINPANLTTEQQNDLCGMCHARNTGSVGEFATSRQDPVGFLPGDKLRDFTKPLSLYFNENVWVGFNEDGSVKGYYDKITDGSQRYWSDGSARSHRMQYNELEMNRLKIDAGFTCMTCHNLHDESTLIGGSWDGLLAADLGSQSCSNCHSGVIESGWDIDVAMPYNAMSSSGAKDIRQHTLGIWTFTSEEIPKVEAK